VPRQDRTDRRRHCHARRCTLILAISISPVFVRVAAAAAPAFQGTFTSASLCSPRGVGVSPSGEVFVGSDCAGHHLERFSTAGTLIDVWSFPGFFVGSANGVALDGQGNVFVTDYEGNRVLKFASTSAFTNSWGSTGTSPGRFLQPVDVATDGSGNVYVLELNGKRVQKFTNGGTYLATIGGAGTGPGQFQSPSGLTVDAAGRVHVVDAARMRVIRFLANGHFDIEFVGPSDASDVAVGPDGNVYVIRRDNAPAQQYTPSGALLLSFEPPGRFSGAHRITIGSTGAMFITEQYNTRISKFQTDMLTTTARPTFGRLKALYR